MRSRDAPELAAIRVDRESSLAAVVDHAVFTLAHIHTRAIERRWRPTLERVRARERMLAEQVNLQDSSNQSAIAVYGHSARFTGNVHRKVDYTRPRFRTGGA